MQPDYRVRLGFAPSPTDPPTWVDVTDRVLETEGWGFQRGRSYELEQMRAGTATVAFLNLDRALDPENIASPYWPNIVPMQRLDIDALVDGVVVDGWTGYITSWQPAASLDGRAITVVSATDALGAFFAQENIGGEIAFNGVSSSGTNAIGGTAGIGSTANDEATGNTSYYLYRSGPITGGYITFTFTYGGSTYTTIPIPWNFTSEQLRLALEMLPSIGPGAIALNAPNYQYNPLWIVFGGKFAGQAVTGLALNSYTTPVAYTLTYKAPKSGTAPPEYFPVPGARRIKIAITGTVDTTAYCKFSILGTNALSNESISEQIVFGSQIGAERPTLGPSPVLYSAQTYRTIYQIFPRIDAANLGLTYTISFDDAIPSQLSSADIVTMAGATGWPVSSISVETGRSTLQATTLTGQTALSLLQQVADSESGTLFMSAAGNLVFHNRHHRLLASSVATFSDLKAEGLPYVDLPIDYSDTYIYNDIRVTRVGGVEQIAQDSTSIKRYRRRNLPKSNMLFTTDTESASSAKWRLKLYKDAKTRFPSMPLVDKDVAGFWSTVLSRELGDKITVKRRPPGGGDPIVRDVHIEGIKWRYSNMKWSVEWSLSPSADNTSIAVFGPTTYFSPQLTFIY